jgi:hypothetical protein
MGMTFTAWINGGSGNVDKVTLPAIDPESLAVAAMLARPFTLQRETIHGPKVSTSLVRFADTPEQVAMCEQVRRLWQELPFRRMKTFKGYTDGRPILPSEGVWDSEVADRVLYSQLVHADDARDLLEHFDEAEQQWNLAGFVGDWLAVIAHQQALLHWVRPDLCASATPWSGTPETIFNRMGVTPSTEYPGDEGDST